MSSPVAGGDGVNDGYPDMTPAELTPEAAKTETGARAILLSFARAIELKEYDQAWNMLGTSAKREWSKSAFNEVFANLDKITVAVPDGMMEGAAGSVYYTVPMSITSTDTDGRPIAIEGPIVLRRVNDVPGSTAEQRKWHIESLELNWTH